MFIQFHEFSNGKLILVPIHAIKFIIDHHDGGASIHTNVMLANVESHKSFRSKESTEQIHKLSKRNYYLSDGILSNL